MALTAIVASARVSRYHGRARMRERENLAVRLLGVFNLKLGHLPTNSICRLQLITLLASLVKLLSYKEGKDEYASRGTCGCENPRGSYSYSKVYSLAFFDIS